MEETSREIIETSSEKYKLGLTFSVGAQIGSQGAGKLRYYVTTVCGLPKLNPTLLNLISSYLISLIKANFNLIFSLLGHEGKN